MAEIIHKIDPNPDTVIILENPTAPFAAWDTSDDTLVDPTDSFPEPDDTTTLVAARKAYLRDRRRALENKAENASINDAATSSKTISAAHTTSDLSQVNAKDEIKTPTVQYLVSSRHLTLASPWFHRALTRSGWTESDRDADGRYCIRTSGWDADALLILLNILHLRNRQVPRTVSLEILAKIAVLVDYYECGEAIDIFGEVWTKALEDAIVPTVMGRELVLWVWVAWSFGLGPRFEEGTGVAVRCGVGEFDALDLPVPAAVTEAIDKARQEGMLKIQAGLRALLDEYRSNQYVCPVGRVTSSFACGSIMYGALAKGMDTVGISTEGDSFDGISIDELCADTQKINSPTWYHSGSSGYYQSQHRCNLQRPIKAMVDEVEESLKGLKLDEISKNT